MSFIERFGLGALFVLCGLILIVGLFGEDDVAAAARKQDARKQDLSARAGMVPGGGASNQNREWNNLRPVPKTSQKKDLTLQPEPKAQSPKPQAQPSTPKSKIRKKKTSKTPRPKTRTWKVRSGDSLARVAQRSYGRQGPKVLRFLAKANGMKVRSILKLGRVLKVPALPASFHKKTTRAVK